MRKKLTAFWQNPSAEPTLWAENATLDAAWPVNRVEGRDAILNDFVTPVRAALTGCQRRDILFWVVITGAMLVGIGVPLLPIMWAHSITHCLA